MVRPARFERATYGFEDVINKNVGELLEKGLIDRSIAKEVIRTEKSHMVINKLKSGKQLYRVANPIFDENGKLSLVIVHERDMTELYLLKSNLKKVMRLAKDTARI